MEEPPDTYAFVNVEPTRSNVVELITVIGHVPFASVVPTTFAIVTTSCVE